MSSLYPDLPLTSFPTEIDSQFPREDVGIETVDIMRQYYAFISAGNFQAAQQLLANSPALQRCIINALAMNRIEHQIIALQRFYKDDVQKYILDFISNYADIIPPDLLKEMVSHMESLDSHIGHGGTEQHALAKPGVPGFSEINYNSREQSRMSAWDQFIRSSADLNPFKTI